MLESIKDIKSHSVDGVSQLWFTPENQYYTREIYSSLQPELNRRFPLYIISTNDEHCFKNYYRRRESSEVFSIELVLEGSMKFVQNDKKYHVTSGNVFFVHHGQNNEFSTGPEGHCHRFACLMGGHDLNALLYTTKLIEHDVIKLNNLEVVKRIMCECFNELKEKKAGFRSRASILCYVLLLELSKNLEHMHIPDLLLRAMDLMEHHLSQQLSLKKIAKILNTTPISLSRVFQQYLKNSPINYFINLKMEAAKSLLQNTNMQTQKIAENTGYSNGFYFSSEFKKRIGMSPREFRKKVNL